MDGEPLVSQFTEALDQAVNRFRDQGLTVAEAVGCLELVKLQIIRDALDSTDEVD